jgi:Metal binding domain of Ada
MSAKTQALAAAVESDPGADPVLHWSRQATPSFPRRFRPGSTKIRASRPRKGARATPRPRATPSFPQRFRRGETSARRGLHLSDPRWAAVRARAPCVDGAFFYSVQTTCVYCRASCAARSARPENVAFHATRGRVSGRRGRRALPPHREQRRNAHARGARPPRRTQRLPRPSPAQSGHRCDPASVRSCSPRQARPRGVRHERYRDLGHLRGRLRLPGALLRPFSLLHWV